MIYLIWDTVHLIKLTFLNEDVYSGWLRVGGATRVVALVALQRRGEGEPAGGPPGSIVLPGPCVDLDAPPGVVVDHTLVVVPEDEGRWCRGVLWHR